MVSRGHGGADAGARAGADLGVSAAAAVSHRVVLAGDAVGDRHHPDEQLRVPELPGAGGGHPAARRRLRTAMAAGADAAGDGGAAKRGNGAGRGARTGAEVVFRAGTHGRGRGRATVFPDVDLLRHDGADGLDGVAGCAAADRARGGAGTVPDCEPVWTFRGDDARAIRNRISRLARWRNLDALSFPLQAAGPECRTADFRSVPAALRLEPVVCVARQLAAKRFRGGGGRAPADEFAGRAGAVFGEPVCQCAAARGARDDLAILVHRQRREATGAVVAPGIAGALRTVAGALAGWEVRHRIHAGAGPDSSGTISSDFQFEFGLRRST